MLRPTVIEVKFEQKAKAPLPIEVTSFEIIIEVSEVHPSNAPGPMDVIEKLKLRRFISFLQEEKAPLPMVFTEEENSTVSRLSAPENALSPIEITPSLKITLMETMQIREKLFTLKMLM